MSTMWAWLLLVVVAALPSVENAGAGAARLVCYVESSRADGYSECTHLVYVGSARGDKLDAVLKEYRKNNPRLKIILRVAEVDKDLRTLLKSKHVQGLEINDAHKTLNRTTVLEKVEAAKSALASSGGGPLFLALPAHPELLAKYYDLRTLVKKVDLMMVQTHALGLVKKMTYHPSRLSGLWDMMNTDSVVDLVVGLGVPASKVVISLPATARQFSLLNETLSTPGSPTQEDEPKEIDQAELCRQLQKGRWTLERDQDLSAPYAFKNKTWVSFEDASSVDVKGKYARVRGLAGLALHKADRDVETPCGPTLKSSLAKVLNQQSRAPRAAVLRSLEHEILSAPGHVRALDALQVSPYRITQIVDSDGVIHSVREDTRTEFSCSRQGYFVHPRSCARFYRCVKFDQLSPEYTVFEFDCPAGLAFDSRYEVCVWPGSLPHSQACPGSSEIAPVPHTRFICPEHEGYYADPENCRWFFACLDHGKSPLTAYEFRCPFGLGFDAEKLKCEWPWLVPACGNIARYEAEAHGFSGAILTGAAGYQGQTADAVNIAAHQSLVSGAALDNLVGIQGGFLTKDDALDTNFIASQELAGGASGNDLSFQVGHGSLAQGQGLAHGIGASLEGQALGHGIAYQAVDASSNVGVGLVHPTKYSDEGKYTSGSLILDDYRLPTKTKTSHGRIQNLVASHRQAAAAGAGLEGEAGRYNGYSTSSFNIGSGQQHNLQYQSVASSDNSGAYVHDPTGDYAVPYRHQSSPAVPYIHVDSPYKHTKDAYDHRKYTHTTQADYDGKYTVSGNTDSAYVDENSGQYAHDNSGDYVESGGYKVGYSGGYDASSGGAYKSEYYGASTGGYNADSGSYNDDNSGAYVHDDSGKYEAGVYRNDGHIGTYSDGAVRGDVKYQAGYSQANANKYLTDTKIYTGASHALTAGAVNVGLVGKTTLVDVDYNNQNNYQVVKTQTLHPGHVSLVSQPAVSINHIGTDGNNLDGYSFVTTPTSSGVPTTATPFAVTTSLPVVTSYKTTFVPEAPKSTIKQVFGFTQPPVTYVQPTVVAVQHVTPNIQVTNYNQGLNYQLESKGASVDTKSNGYDYSYKGASQSAAKSESDGYDYSKPSIKFEEGVTYTTAAPVVVSTYKPQDFGHSQQTIHKIESVGVQYSTPIPVTEEPFKKIVAYTTGPPVTTFAANEYKPHAYSQQTIHKVEASHYPSAEIGTSYQAEVAYEAPKVVQYTTVQPAVAVQHVVAAQPQAVSHQTLHTVDASQVKTYSQASSGSYSQQPSGSYSTGETGYTYEQPAVQFNEGKTVVQYSTPTPVVVSTYRPQVYSQQTIHKAVNHVVPVSSTPQPGLAVSYQAPVTVYKNPILKYTEKVTPVVYEKPAYRGQAYSHQTIHKVENSQAYTPSVGVEYTKSVTYEQPQTIYSTVQPIVAQGAVSLSQSNAYSHQTQHKVDASRVNTYSGSFDAGYTYEKPSIQFEPLKTVEYSTPAPVVVSTYRPQSYSHQTIHKVETQKVLPVSSTIAPIVDYSYKQADVSTYENPIIKYGQKVTPVTYVQPTAAVITQTYQPIVEYEGKKVYNKQNLHIGQEGYSYSQPEIQRNIETSNAANAYSDASVVSHQTFHLSSGSNQYDTGKDVVYVSTTPSTQAYEDHYVDYEAQKTINTYKAPEYVPPKTDYQYTVSTASTPITYQSSVLHKTNDEYDYNRNEYFQQYDASQDTVANKQVSFSTSHISQPKKVESIHLSSFPGTTVTTKYNQGAYQSPEIQVGYKAEEYLPPVVSTVVTPVATSTYRPRTYSTVSTTKEYLPPAVDNSYLPPSSTARPYYKSTTPSYKYVESTTAYKPSEYLPPAEENEAKLVNFESFGFDSGVTASAKINPYQDFSVPKVVPTVITQTQTSAPVQRKQNLVVETAKSHLLGFGTVGPDAGLVSPVTYTTAAPIFLSTTSRPIVKYTTQEPSYKFVQSTTEYQAPEYLPPSEHIDTNTNFGSFGYKNSDVQSEINYNAYDNDAVVVTSAEPKRKQNLVVETAKTHLLGFGTVGPDAGLVSPVTYTTAAPSIVSSSEYYSVPQQTVTSTYAPIQQGLFEVTPTTVPIRKTKPKVAVVTKINDFNPLLVRKLGAVCSCQSPILTLKGKRPTVKDQDSDDYSDNTASTRGDISDNQWALKSERLQSPTVTVTPIVTSTFNPIIVPDDSFYQDYQEPINREVVVTPKKEIYSERYVSSTPLPVSSTEKVYTIRPRTKPVTVAPTYKTVLLNQEVAPVVPFVSSDDAVAVLNSQTFDRYGPGGLRSRGETLQGSVDCQRAGLFRHPKQCNKFYACRWDCTKQRFTLHVFNCPIQLSFDPSIGACNWPSQGPACQGDTLLTNTL